MDMATELQKSARGGARPPLAMLAGAGAMAVITLLAFGLTGWAIGALVVTAVCLVGLVLDAPQRRRPAR